MTSEKILHADMLDILFENRNKNYGAYTLRRNCNSRLYRALALILLPVLALCLLSFYGKDEAVTTAVYTIPDDPIMANAPKDKPAEPEKPKPPVAKTAVPSAPKQVAPTDIFTTPVITAKAADKIHSLNDSSNISNVKTIVPPGTPPAVVVPKVPDVPPGPSAVPEQPAIDHVTPTSFAEVMPSFPGGPEALKRFLQRNLSAPQDMEAGDEVTVKVRFIVGFDGVIKSFETLQDGGAAYNNEVMRVLKKMPLWLPGKTRGENVSVYYVLPVKFTPAD